MDILFENFCPLKVMQTAFCFFVGFLEKCLKSGKNLKISLQWAKKIFKLSKKKN